MLITPSLARLSIGASGRSPAVRVLTRALGIHDVSLGLGLLRATELGHDDHSWLVLGAASDAVDALATLAAFRHLPRLRRWIIVASSGRGVVNGAGCQSARTGSGRLSRSRERPRLGQCAFRRPAQHVVGQPPRRLEQRPKVKSRVVAHAGQQVGHVFGRDVAGGHGRERTASEHRPSSRRTNATPTSSTATMLATAVLRVLWKWHRTAISVSIARGPLLPVRSHHSVLQRRSCRPGLSSSGRASSAPNATSTTRATGTSPSNGQPNEVLSTTVRRLPAPHEEPCRRASRGTPRSSSPDCVG